MTEERTPHEFPQIEVWAERLNKAMTEAGHDPWPADELAHGVMRVCKPSCPKCYPDGSGIDRL